jgi:hypothetical protein
VTEAKLRRAAQRELARRARANRLTTPAFSADSVCYPEQLAFVRSQAKRNVLRKTRRAGGTVALATWFLEGALTAPYANQLYVTSTLKNAKRLIWPTLKKLNAKHGLGGVPNETEAFMRFPSVANEPVIYLGGAKDSEEVEKIRGYEGGIKRAAIDEVQAIRASILETLVDDIIEPSLFDYDGALSLVGTPGPVMAGYFYEADAGTQKHAWEHFFLNMRANPHLEAKSGKPPEQILAELRQRRRWTETNPTYLREYCGQWVTDSDALALHYDRTRNACERQDAPIPGWRYILVFDIGFDDADAIGVLGWAPHDRRLRLVKELITKKQGITELGNQLKGLTRVFSPERTVGDLGALGKKIGEELRLRWGIHVEAADKQRKAEHVGLLDDALITGAFMAPPDSVFAEDCAIVQWDADAKARGLLVFDDSYHSDIIDAVLYGYRVSLHWEEEDEALPLSDDERKEARIAAAIRAAKRKTPEDYDTSEPVGDDFEPGSPWD